MQDTFSAACTQIAKLILESDLFQYVTYKSEQDALRHIVENGFDRKVHSLYMISLSFRNGETDVGLNIDDKFQWKRTGQTSTDDEGNEYCTAQFNFRINYPSHGSGDLATVGKRIELLQKVHAFALMLEKEFSGEFQMLFLTVAEKTERAAQAETQRLLAQYHRLVDEGVKRLRVGKINTVLASEQPAAETKSWPIGDKFYDVWVTNGLMYIKRTA